MRALLVGQCSRIFVGSLLMSFCVMLSAADNSTAGLPLRRASEGESWLLALQALATGALALTAVGAGLLWLRRKGVLNKGISAGAMQPQLVSNRRISQKTSLLVVEWRGHQYLLAENAHATQLLDKHALEQPITGADAV